MDEALVARQNELTTVMTQDEPLMFVEEAEEEESLYSDTLSQVEEELNDDEAGDLREPAALMHSEGPSNAWVHVEVDLPAMPKISFSLMTDPEADVAAAGPETCSTEPEVAVVQAKEEPRIESGPALVPEVETAVLATRLAVTRESNRIWATLRGERGGNTPVALEGSKASREPARMYFDKVDEEVDLDADPILKQVMQNKNNPGSAQTDRPTMKDLMAKIIKPFEDMAASRAQRNRASENDPGSQPLPQHYGDLPHLSNSQHELTILAVGLNMISSCAVLGKLIGAAVLSILAFVFPIFRNVLSHLVVVWGRFLAACNSRRNGEFVPVRDRLNNAGWCMWSHISSRNGLGNCAHSHRTLQLILATDVTAVGTLTGLLVIYSYWKLEHEFWG